MKDIYDAIFRLAVKHRLRAKSIKDVFIVSIYFTVSIFKKKTRHFVVYHE